MLMTENKAFTEIKSKKRLRKESREVFYGQVMPTIFKVTHKKVDNKIKGLYTISD